jgi:glycerol-3-phosphate dehydrogenase
MNYSLLTFILDSTGMVAALTNESATSKSVYFAHCTSEMIFITHMLAEEPEKLAGPLLADTYVTLLKGRNAWYGQNLAKGELSLEMGDSIKGKGMIQVWILIICKLVNKQTQKISNYVESHLI